MTTTEASPDTRQAYWNEANAKYLSRQLSPPGEDLAALRRGLGRDAGSVPEMWRFYRKLDEKGTPTKELKAEHAALTLFALHQQSQRQPMHKLGIGLGTAVRKLKESGHYSEDAVDRRFAAAATATSLGELTLHLRGLITQLRSIGQPLDYDKLYADLLAYQWSDHLGAIRRRWGGQYFVSSKKTDNTSTGASS